jgi:uncharacterized membrane protein YqhA
MFTRIIEKILWQSRFMVFFAVVSAIISALIMIILGCVEVTKVVSDLIQTFSIPGGFEGFSKSSVSHLVSAIDDYLIGTVFLIFGIGLYELS